MAVILNKIKKAGNVLMTLLIIVSVGVLSVEAVKLNNGEDNFFDQLAAAVDELSMKTSPSLISTRETEDDSGSTTAIETERNKNGPSKSSNDSNAETTIDKTGQVNPTNREAEEQPQVHQEQQNRKAENLDLPPEKVVFHKDLAAENIRLLNAERKKRGIPELKVNDTLMNVAHIKVDDMMSYNYYGHGSPRIGCTTDYVVKKIGNSATIISENLNLFKKPTFWYSEYDHLFSDDLVKMAQMAHDSLMRSDGHRENMLNPELVYVGVAAAGNVIVEDGEEYYVFKVAQVFMSE